MDVYYTEFNLREKLTQEVAGLKVELECAKQRTKGRKSLAPKLMDDKGSICTDSEAGKPVDVGECPSTTVKGSDQHTQSSCSTGKEEEAHAEETPKTEENKENLENVSSAKMVGTATWLVNPCKLPVLSCSIDILWLVYLWLQL